MIEVVKESPDHSTMILDQLPSNDHTHINEHPSHGFRQPFELAEPPYLTKAVKFPTFSEIDPQGWLTRAETYFKVQRTPEHHRIPLAHICMESVAVHWFSIVRELKKNLLWGDFKGELLNRFSGVANFSLMSNWRHSSKREVLMNTSMILNSVLQ